MDQHPNKEWITESNQMLNTEDAFWGFFHNVHVYFISFTHAAVPKMDENLNQHK